MEHLRPTLKFPRKHQLYVKLRKYDFYRDRIQYLGEIISNKGIYVDPEKIESIMSWTAPRKTKKVRYFV